jgi:flavin reductase (DIM6/NTAB) family NADH-FMN oxidoreductase RutF
MLTSSAKSSGSEGLDAAAYRATLRRHPAGVAVITLTSPTGPVGFTATSFASLSLDPPLVSFNITHTSSSITALRQAQSIVVHLLGDHQLDTAQRFSRSADLRFTDTTTWSTLDTGEPLLHDTPTWLRVDVRQLIDAGDSTLVIGLVVNAHCVSGPSDQAPTPLIYHYGGYHRTTPISSD